MSKNREQNKVVAEELLKAVPLAMRVLRAEFRSLAKPKLTVPQFRVLMHLSQGACNNNELAEILGVSVAAMSRMVCGLFDRGYISRDKHEDDRRQIQLELTGAGRQTVKALRLAVQDRLARRVSSLSSTQKRALVEGLTVIEELFE